MFAGVCQNVDGGQLKAGSPRFPGAWWKKTASFIATIHKGENICHLVSAKQRNTHVLKLTVEELKKLSEKISEQVAILEAQKNRINGAIA